MLVTNILHAYVSRIILSFVLVRFQLAAGTRLMILENVVSGSIHKLTADILSHDSKCAIETIHAATQDSGYAANRRYRGWKLVLQERGYKCSLHSTDQQAI